MLIIVKRTTICLPDPLQEALEDYQRDQKARLPTSTLVLAAVREYLQRRGYGKPTPGSGFHITPAQHGSGTSDTSVDHDRYLAEAASR